MIKAEEARRRTDEMNKETTEQLKVTAEGLVENALRNGLSTVSLDIPRSHVQVMKNWFTQLGYTVEEGNSQRDGQWFHISW